MHRLENPIVLTAGDGYPLAATHYVGGPKAVLIAGAMAVAQKFYSPLARYLQRRGYTVLTFDYRGIGDSFPVTGTLRGFRASVSDWAHLDLEFALRWLADRPGISSVDLVGHSLGGQIVGMTETAPRLRGAVTLSSQSGYWKLQGGREPWRVLIHMYLTFPLLSRLVGYMPWSRFARATDVPKQVALQWASWCRHPEYLFGDSSLPLHRYANVKAEILAISIDDDDWGSRRSVDALMRRYPNCTRRHIFPSEFDRETIGHFSFFRAGNDELWKMIPLWLEDRAV